MWIMISKWRRPSGSEKKVDPATETRKREKHKKTEKHPSKRRDLRVDSPPDKMCSVKHIGPSKYGVLQTDGEG